MNIALIGYRGTGKTTVARLLAEELGWLWIDADVELERRAGRTIKQIFAESGEPAFRDLEQQVLADLVQLHHTVLALGGGCVMREANRRALAQSLVVWLRADAETLWRRINGDSVTQERRPNLTVAGGLAEIQNLLAIRTPVYEQLAALSVNTAELSPAEVAREIAASALIGVRAAKPDA